MIRSIGVFIIIGALALLAYGLLPIQFYLKPGFERLQTKWQDDLVMLETKKGYSDIFPNIKTVELIYTDPQVAKELDGLRHPFTENASGKYTVRIGVIRWIDGHQYGYVLQHEIFEGPGDNEEKLFEFGRTYTTGIFW